MTTVEPNLSVRGDCIVAVGAETGLKQLPAEIKEAARDPETQITLTLRIDSIEFLFSIFYFLFSILLLTHVRSPFPGTFPKY